MGANVKRVFTATSAALLVTVAIAGPAAADSSTAPGPGICGVPGQDGLVQVAKDLLDVPPGQVVSLCNGHGHGGGGAS